MRVKRSSSACGNAPGRGEEVERALGLDPRRDGQRHRRRRRGEPRRPGAGATVAAGRGHQREADRRRGHLSTRTPVARWPRAPRWPIGHADPRPARPRRGIGGASRHPTLLFGQKTGGGLTGALLDGHEPCDLSLADVRYDAHSSALRVATSVGTPHLSSLDKRDGLPLGSEPRPGEASQGAFAWRSNSASSTRSCSRRRATTSGCTSRTCRPTARPSCRSSSAARGRTCSTARQALPRLPGRAVHRADRLLARRGARRGRCSSRWPRLPYYTNWTYAHPPADRARRQARRARAGEHQALFFVSGGSEAVEAAIKLARQYHAPPRPADAPQGDRAQDRLPRHDEGRALDHRHPGDPHAVRAADGRRPPRREHEPLPLQVLRRQGRAARCSAPTRSRRRSSSRVRRRSRW